MPDVMVRHEKEESPSRTILFYLNGACARWPMARFVASSA